MYEDFERGEPPVKEYEKRTLNAARMYSLLRQEDEIGDPWHILVWAICSFEEMHIKEGWEFVLTNRRDIEDVGQLFERADSPEEFREGLIELKERDLRERLERRGALGEDDLV